MDQQILLFLLIISTAVDYTFSAILLHFGLHSENDYLILSKTKTYKGLLFSFSAIKKDAICRDYFQRQLYAASDPKLGNDESTDVKISDGTKTVGEPQYPLIVKNISIANRHLSDYQDTFFKCEGENFLESKAPFSSHVFISTAFRPGFLFGNYLEKKNKKYMIPSFYIGMSPDHVPLDQDQLEEKYMNIRQRMEALKKESSEYIQLVEDKDDLSDLSRWQKLLLCSSILSSPIYQVDRLEFSMNWMYLNEEKFEYVAKVLSFKGRKHKIATLSVDCIHCKGFEDNLDQASKSTDLFLTRSYVDKNSLYVLIQKDGVIYLSKYFENAAILMNPHEYFFNGLLVTDYW